jgi:GH24 family phage-related lysozyme (muramidase)
VSATRRFSQPILALVAFAVLALAISACTVYKPGTFSVSQPAGIGSVRVHLALCSATKEGACIENTGEAENQSLLAIAVPKGASAPGTITAAPTSGGPAIVFSRNDQVAQAISEASQGGEEPWPPAGTEGIGYLSNVFKEENGVREWTVDADFGLPPTADGAPYAGPFPFSAFTGTRLVGEFAPGENAGPGDRPVDCFTTESGEPPQEDDAICEFVESGSFGTSDLKVGAPTTTARVYVGGNATLQFGFDFASTATALPTFNVTAGSSLSGAALAVSNPTFTPAAPAPDTHRSSGSETVTVTVPSTAGPGLYDVTLTVKTDGGATLTQTGKVEVLQAKIKLGKVKLNKKKGTAVLSVGVPTAGTLTLSGKGLAKAQRKAKAAKTLKVTIKAKGKAKKKLGATGKAKVKAKIVFKPENGAPVTKTKSIVLKKKLT